MYVHITWAGVFQAIGVVTVAAIAVTALVVIWVIVTWGK